MNKLLLGLISSTILLVLNINPVQALPPNDLAEQDSEPTNIIFTPLGEQLFSQPTAKYLGSGEVLINLNTRTFFFPDLVEGELMMRIVRLISTLALVGGSAMIYS